MMAGDLSANVQRLTKLHVMYVSPIAHPVLGLLWQDGHQSIQC